MAHMHGCPAAIDRIAAVAEGNEIRVIEDAALAWGAWHHGRPVGSLGDIGCFSFAPTKILGTYGDAGAVVTNDSDLAERVRTLGNYGHAIGPAAVGELVREAVAWDFVAEGRNARLDELQAAILNVKLARVSERIAARQRIAARYSDLLADLPMSLPADPDESLDGVRPQVRRGYSDEDITKIIGGNWVRVFSEVWEPPDTVAAIAPTTHEDWLFDSGAGAGEQPV